MIQLFSNPKNDEFNSFELPHANELKPIIRLGNAFFKENPNATLYDFIKLISIEFDQIEANQS